MAARLTREDRLQRLVDKTRKRVDEGLGSTQSLRQSPDSMLGTLVREAGYGRTTPQLLRDLDERLRGAGIGTHPELTDPSNTRRTRIHFFDLKNPLAGFQLPRQLFAKEEELSRFLWLNRTVLPYLKKNGLRIRAPEARIANNCVIDFLAEDKHTSELVGIELKVAEPQERIVVQAEKYMRALGQQAAKEGRPGARLLIVTGQPDQSLNELVQQHAVKHGVKTQWLLYRVSIDLFEVK